MGLSRIGPVMSSARRRGSRAASAFHLARTRGLFTNDGRRTGKKKKEALPTAAGRKWRLSGSSDRSCVDGRPVCARFMARDTMAQGIANLWTGRISCRARRMKKPGVGPGKEAPLDANQPAWHYGSGGVQRLSTLDGE